MFRCHTFLVSAIASVGLALSIASPSAQATLLLSENWSTGTFGAPNTNNWQRVNNLSSAGDDNFFIGGGNSTTLTATPTLGPYNGNANYAYSDQNSNDNTQSALYTTFVVPVGFSQIEVKFNAYATTGSAAGAGNDSLALGNVNARADVLNSGAPILSTTAGDVASEIYSASVHGFSKTGWALGSNFGSGDAYVFHDRQAIPVVGGQSYIMRFAVSTDGNTVNLSIGDVEIDTFGSAGGVATPEPSTLVLMAFSAVGVGLVYGWRTGKQSIRGSFPPPGSSYFSNT